MTTPLSCRWRSVVLLALIVGMVIASPHAAVSIVWRASLLSFDDPASQVLDELACQKTSHTDPLLEVDKALRAAAATSVRLCPSALSADRQSPSLGYVEARAPPSV